MNQFIEIFQKQRQYFSTDVIKTYEWRIDQLNRLERLIKENEDDPDVNIDSIHPPYTDEKIAVSKACLLKIFQTTTSS